MKKVIGIMLAMIMVLSLCSCASNENIAPDSQKPSVNLSNAGKKGPAEEMIMEDLKSALQEENEYAVVTGVETVKSLSDEGTYEITLTVTAQTKYADWTYEADMAYTKYDQGWMVDCVEWTSEDYALARVPDIETITDIANNNEELGDRVPVENGTMDSTNTFDTEIIELSWSKTEKMMHAEKNTRYTTLWTYNKDIDNWEFTPFDEDASIYEECQITPYNVDFSGVYNDPNYSGDFWGYDCTGSIEIGNFSWDGFNVKMDDGSTDSFERTSAPSFGGSSDEIRWYSNGEGKYLCIHFNVFTSYTEITLYEGGGRSAGVLFSATIDKELPLLN